MKINADGYYRNRHSCFLLQYHLVLVTKYRKPVIAGGLDEDLKAYTDAFFKERGMPVRALETMPDHIHVLFDALPQINLAEFINSFKSASSRTMRKHHAGTLSKYYWEPYFWSLSYFVGTVSDRTQEAVAEYIKTQKG